MSTLRALESAEPLERFVELTKIIRQLEAERDALKPLITEALQHEPPSDNRQQYVDFDGFRVELATRPSYVYSDDVKRLEKQIKDLKARERHSGKAHVKSWGFHTRCTPHRATNETAARERKATAIAAYLAQNGLTSADAASWVQAERDAVARRAGQHSPSEKTWALVLSKLEAQKKAA